MSDPDDGPTVETTDLAPAIARKIDDRDFRGRLEQARDFHSTAVDGAMAWLAYNREAVAYYEAWLASPDLDIPSREFPTYNYWTILKREGRL